MKTIFKSLILTSCLFTAMPNVVLATDTNNDNKICTPKKYDMALTYQQQSAEIMALQLQTYHFATETFLAKIAQLDKPENYAIVVDLDETVIDNTPLLVRDVQNCHDFSSWDTWDAWEKSGSPTLIPGAKDFLNTVNDKKVHIFYVSDRSEANKDKTLATLRKLGLPQIAASNTLLLDKASKQERRASIMKNYQIIMLLGDSLPDFDESFKTAKTTTEQRHLVEKNANQFGTKWIILPNASYGTWIKRSIKGHSWQKK